MTSSNSKSVAVSRFRAVDYIKISLFGFAIAALWSSLHTIVLQVRLLDFVPESSKNTYLGYLTFTGLILAMLVQPIAGAISDRSGFGWGRRRPFILLGTLLVLMLLPGIVLARNYVAIFVVYCLLQISSNTAHGPYQGFIPDLVPAGKLGLASGVKTMFEILGGIALLFPIALFMNRYSAGQGGSWLWLGLGMPAIVLLVAMVATTVTVKEERRVATSQMSLSATLYKTFKIDVKASPGFIWFLASRLFVVMAYATLQTFAFYFLKDVVGLADPASATAKYLIVTVAGTLVLVYPAGLLSDKIGRKPVVIFAGVLGALGIVLIFMFQHSLTSVVLCGGLVGMSFGTFMSTNWALAVDLVPPGEEARYLGLTNLATAGGAALARLMGPVIDFYNAAGPNLGYSVMLLGCFICFIVGSVLVLGVKKRR